MTKPSRIVCIGNPFVEEDAGGSRVFALLRSRELPPGVEAIDGGLASPSLFLLAEGARRLVFVDSVSGWAAPGSVVELAAEDVIESDPGVYGHAAGLAFLLRTLPLVSSPVPGISVIGLETPAIRESVEIAADLAIARAGAP